VEEENVTTILPFIAPLYMTYDLHTYYMAKCTVMRLEEEEDIKP
jgi:hypothetical protein